MTERTIPRTDALFVDRFEPARYSVVVIMPRFGVKNFLSAVPTDAAHTSFTYTPHRMGVRGLRIGAFFTG